MKTLTHNYSPAICTYPENQVTVIDAYYKGSNGWTYSHTLLNDKEVSLDINETYEDLYLTRVLNDNPEPQYNLLNKSIYDTVTAKSANGDLLEYDFSKNRE